MIIATVLLDLVLAHSRLNRAVIDCSGHKIRSHLGNIVWLLIMLLTAIRRHSPFMGIYRQYMYVHIEAMMRLSKKGRRPTAPLIL
jgi:hypothetical protein